MIAFLWLDILASPNRLGIERAAAHFFFDAWQDFLLSAQIFLPPLTISITASKHQSCHFLQDWDPLELDFQPDEIHDSGDLIKAYIDFISGITKPLFLVW